MDRGGGIRYNAINETAREISRAVLCRLMSCGIFIATATLSSDRERAVCEKNGRKY